MQQSRFVIFSLLLLFSVSLASCETEDPFQFEPPDLSTVPGPFDTTNVDPVTIEDGVQAYIYNEGYGPFKITLRDQVTVFLTLRSESGEIIYSTFSSDRVAPLPISMSLADGKNVGIHQTINQSPGGYTILLAYTPGFKESLLGMQQGEKMTLVVSPEKAYKNIPQNTVNTQYADSTLIYDIRISSISPKKSQ